MFSKGWFFQLNRNLMQCCINRDLALALRCDLFVIFVPKLQLSGHAIFLRIYAL
jgi:hypothetical protein